MINNKVFREFLKIFKVHLIVEWIFKTFPQRKRFGQFSYTVGSLEAWLVEKEIFKENRLMVSLLNHVQLNALGLKHVPASLQIFPEQF